jgi:hypothetical protein
VVPDRRNGQKNPYCEIFPESLPDTGFDGASSISPQTSEIVRNNIDRLFFECCKKNLKYFCALRLVFRKLLSSILRETELEPRDMMAMLLDFVGPRYNFTLTIVAQN